MNKTKSKLFFKIGILTAIFLIVIPISVVAIDVEPPDANAGKDRFVSTGDLVILDGSKSHDDQTPDHLLEFQWEQVDTSVGKVESTVVLENADTVKASFVAPEYVGDLAFQLTVHDEVQKYDTDEVVITIFEDLNNSIFVSNTFGDEENDGTMFSPVNDIEKAFELATTTTQLVSNWLDHPVMLDGRISTVDEWSESIPFRVPLNREWGWPDKQMEPSDKTLTIRLKNDDEWLYLLYQIPWSRDDVDHGDVAAISLFEGPMDPLWTKSDYSGVSFGNYPCDLFGWDEYRWYWDTGPSPPGQNNVDGAATHDGESYWFEFKKMLDSGDGRDWSLIPGEMASRPEIDDLGIGIWDESEQSTYGQSITLRLSNGENYPSNSIADIYIEEGSYPSDSTLRIYNGMSVYGGFSIREIYGLEYCLKWKRDALVPTVIKGAATAFEVINIEDYTVIDGLTIISANGKNGILTGGAGENSIAIYVDGANVNLHITNNFINAGKGGDGKPGDSGANGRYGGHGGILVGDYLSGPQRGDSPVGMHGGRGGAGGLIKYSRASLGFIIDILNNLDDGDPCAIAEGFDGTNGFGLNNHGNGGNAYITIKAGLIPPELGIEVHGDNGDPAVGAIPPKIKANGLNGTDGLGGQNNSIEQMLFYHKWVANSGEDGTDATHGFGGGGGGGGGGAIKFKTIPLINIPLIPLLKYGGAGGGGGGGGEGGKGGKGGYGGGASFGIFLYNADKPYISNNTISTAGGGNGGNGGWGGDGGIGGEGAWGVPAKDDDAGNGGLGGPGGDGGTGGRGGGGAGGSSCGIYRADPDRSIFEGVNCFNMPPQNPLSPPSPSNPPGESLIGPAGLGGIGGEGRNGGKGCRGNVCPPQIGEMGEEGNGDPPPVTVDLITGETINSGETLEHIFTMMQGIRFAVFRNIYPGSDIVMSFMSPSGRIINRNTVYDDVLHERRLGIELYIIVNPEEGDWQITLYGADLPPEGEPTYLSVGLTPFNTPPVAIAKDVVVVAGTDGLAKASINDGSYDSDRYDNIWITQTPNGPYSCGDTLVTLTVYDKQGAFDTTQAIVTVVDETPPLLEVPSILYAKADESGGTTVIIEPIVSDNCDPNPVVSKSHFGDWFPIGVTEVIFTATDASGNSVAVPVSVAVVENLPPITSDDYEYDDVWTNQDALITLTFSDASPSSGWLWTKYCVDETGASSPDTDFTEPISITHEGISYLRYHSMDIAENLEPINQVIVKIDKTAPETMIEFGDIHFSILDNIHLTSTTPITLIPAEIKDGSGISGTYYKLFNDTYNSGWIHYSDIFTLNFLGLLDGEYTLHYYSTDIAGNNENIKFESIILDNSPPMLSWEYEGYALQDVFIFEIESLDATGVSSVTLSIQELNGPMVAQIPVEYIGENKWRALDSFDTTTLPDGYYEFVVDASDLFSFTTTKVFDFSIRNWAVLVLLPSTESNKAGRTMPIKFSLRVSEAVDPNMPFVVNQELDIFITDTATGEVFQHSTYGDGSKNYRIDELSEHYITNFKTHKNPTIYLVSIYRRDFLIDEFTFATVK